MVCEVFINMFSNPVINNVFKKDIMAKVVLTNIASRYGSIDALNDNFDALATALDNTLSRDGEGPNEVEANIDMNSNRIINLADPVDNTDAVTKQYVDGVTAELSGIAEEIQTVADNIAAIEAVAGAAPFIEDNINEIIVVADNIDNIVDVAGELGNIELVALELNGAFQQGVVYDFGYVTEAPIGEVEETTSSIITVGENITDVNSVSTNIADINLVADNIAEIDSIVANLTDIQNADTYAANALASSNLAQEWATKLVNPVSGSDYSAKYNANLAATSATNASNSASAASTSATAAQAAADSALAALDSFDDRYLGTKTSDPSVDNDGNALVAGALYYRSTSPVGMKVYTGSIWVDSYADGNTFLAKAANLSDLANVVTARTNLGLGSLATKSTVGVAELAATLDYGSIV
jgi:hypothetical protein